MLRTSAAERPGRDGDGLLRSSDLGGRAGAACAAGQGRRGAGGDRAVRAVGREPAELGERLGGQRRAVAQRLAGLAAAAVIGTNGHGAVGQRLDDRYQLAGLAGAVHLQLARQRRVGDGNGDGCRRGVADRVVVTAATRQLQASRPCRPRSAPGRMSSALALLKTGTGVAGASGAGGSGAGLRRQGAQLAGRDRRVLRTACLGGGPQPRRPGPRRARGRPEPGRWRRSSPRTGRVLERLGARQRSGLRDRARSSVAGAYSVTGGSGRPARGLGLEALGLVVSQLRDLGDLRDAGASAGASGTCLSSPRAGLARRLGVSAVVADASDRLGPAGTEAGEQARTAPPGREPRCAGRGRCGAARAEPARPGVRVGSVGRAGATGAPDGQRAGLGSRSRRARRQRRKVRGADVPAAPRAAGRRRNRER